MFTGPDPTRIDPDKPGYVNLVRAWMTGDYSVMAAIAVIGSCALFVVIVTGLAEIASRL